MAYRITIHLSGVDQTHSLTPGENLVGNGADCDLHIEHATVSRHHALLVVGSTGIQLADLGSSNGTSIESTRIRNPVDICVPAMIHFGAVAATLVEIGEDDLEEARIRGQELQFAAQSKVITAAPSPTTASIQPVQMLALAYLPRVADALASGEGPIETARRFGQGVLQALPTDAVDIMFCSGESVFFAGSDELQGSQPAFEAVGGSVRLCLHGGRAADFEIVRPLLETGCSLVSAAALRHWESPQETCDEPEAWPEPQPLDPAMQEIYRRALRVAPSSLHVLIRGGSGTGKEVLARFIHQTSDRRNKAFEALNCAALPADLLEAELFGIESGVATGVNARAGHFERADGGTLFLDEIGEMAPPTQAKILRVLQGGEVYRIGGSAPRPARARIISATNRNLQKMLESGEFRSDLYYRIADWEVELPLLRNRVLDIPNFASYFLAIENREHQRRIRGFSRAALRALIRHEWPGNVRQLEREIARGVLFTEDGQLLDSTCLSAAICTENAPLPSLRDGVNSAEKQLIEMALAEVGGDVATVSEVLDVPMSTLYRKLKQHRIEN